MIIYILKTIIFIIYILKNGCVAPAYGSTSPECSKNDKTAMLDQQATQVAKYI
jgi:hypothetical protein